MSALWIEANRRLIAKSLGELAYEQVLKPVAASSAVDGALSLRLDLASGVRYEFEAWRGVWDHLRVKPASIRRQGEPAVCAGRFFLDCQRETGMTDITLGCFIEEMQNTLYADQALLAKRATLSVSELADRSSDDIQSVLDGHPKILLNKGRLGWSACDIDELSPEASRPFRLHWVAALKERAVSGFATGVSGLELLAESFDEGALRAFLQLAREKGADPERYHFMPVHPWQWERWIRVQYQGSIARGALIGLGAQGDLYRPQISLRTLSNHSRPGRSDLKLPLTILNTSAYRGIPVRYAPLASQLSAAVARVCREDELLKSAGTSVLSDLGAVAVPHETYSAIPEAPYRFGELLAAIWRESPASRPGSGPGDKAVIAGCLFHQDGEGRSLLAEFAARSGLGIAAWLERYFEAVVVPLYHLQVRYGLGWVAHGQNVVLKLEAFKPAGLLLKDFQSDLRLSKEPSPLQEKYFGPFLGTLDRLPAAHLIHDLYTGHFVTLMRFVSETLWESDGFAETEFYSILSRVLARYRGEQGLTGDVATDILAPLMPRVLVNKVRFKIGYGDTAERPVPMLGGDLANPLCVPGGAS